MGDFVTGIMPVAPLVLILVYLFGSLALFAFRNRERLKDPPPDNPREHSFFIHHIARSYWQHRAEPIANFILRRDIHPNYLTVISFIFSLAAGVLFVFGFTGLAGWFILFSGAFDSLDGRVAHMSHKSSKRGAFLDSTLDRAGELFVFSGITLYYFLLGSPAIFVPLLAIIGSVVVSYARARGQSLGVDFNKGIMQRAERLIYVASGAIFEPVFRHFLYPDVKFPYVMTAFLAVVAFFSCYTAIYRTIKIFILLKHDDDQPTPRVRE